MPNLLSTNLNQNPYWSDFSEDKQYYRVLSKPGFPVQARELNVVQDIIQNQITDFGENIFAEGSIVSGVNISFNPNLNYVKILDNYANGSPITISDLSGFTLSSNTGLKAYINMSQQGYVAQAPNLNTLFISYLNSATTNSQIKVFQNDEFLNVLNGNNVIGQVQVANTISSGSSNTTGYSYSLAVSNGVIFQKGILLKVESQNLLLSPYNNTPDGISVGFNCIEQIITPYQDDSLLDNAQGAPNYAAPGADRLRIVPTLTLRQTNSISTNNFFSIVDFVGGTPSIINQETVYSIIGDKMAEYSFETNGDFIVNPFPIRLLQNYFANGGLDSANIKLEIDGGIAYIDGHRVQVVGKLVGSLPKGSTVLNAPSQIITTEMGNYLQAKEVAGFFNPTTIQTVQLRSAPAYAVSNNIANGVSVGSISAPGSQIGNANLLAITYDNGTLGLSNCVYDLYLFNIQMNTGQTFNNVKSIYSSSPAAFADLVLNSNSVPTFFQPSLTPLVYSFNQGAVKTLKTAANTLDAQFQFVQSANVTFSSGGTVTVTIPTSSGGTNQLPFGAGTLANPQKLGFIIVSNTAIATANIAGSVSNTSAANLTGSGTSFTTALAVGGFIYIANSTVNEVKQIGSITNNTVLTLTSNLVHSWTGANVAVQYLNGMEIPTNSANITVSNSTTFSITVPYTFSTTFNASVLYPIVRTVAAPAKKTLQVNTFICINLSNNAGGVTGPWSLGIPDVLAVSNVWYGSSYSTNNQSITSQFHLNNNQTDQYYGLSYLTSNGASLSSANFLLVQVEAYLPTYSSGSGYFSVDSYPIDDTGVTANSIYTQDIQTYNSIANGSSYNLRNCMDFRFYAQNTIPYISTAALAVVNTAIVNPPNTLTFSTSNLYVPVPDAIAEASLQYYVGRYDVVGIDDHGTIVINSGVPSENPYPAGDIKSGITLATVKVPPYPSLTSDVVDPNSSGANPIASLVYKPNKRYTMADIGVLDVRVTQAEYYSSLNLLEQSAQNILLSSASGANRFNQGILADPFQDFSIADVANPEFNCAIDPSKSQLRPTFSQYPFNFVYSNSVSQNSTLSPDGSEVLLSYVQNTTPFISQQFASQEINTSQSILYCYHGIVTLTPTGNWTADVTQPATVSNSAVAPSTNVWSQNILTASEAQNVLNSQGGTGNSAWKSTTTTSSSTSTSTSATSTTSTGNINITTAKSVSSVTLQAFCPPQLVKFTATGLKPSTQMWTYFNDVPISNLCVQSNSSVIGSPMTSDANGTLSGTFYLPSNTFYASAITFKVLDISNLVTQSNIVTSIATTTYYGTNLAYTLQAGAITQPAVSTATQVITIHDGNLQRNVNVFSNSTVTIFNEPVAQGFPINQTALPQGIQGVWITSIDIFFAATDANLGITLQIRDMVNGYPGINIQAGGQIHILPSQITTSQNASKATNIVFPAPIWLDAGSQYCFVLIPDGANPNYDVWSGTISGVDVTTGAPIFALASGGDMFLSSQNLTWTAYQNQSLKFNLYIANFTASQGTFAFVNDSKEFLAVANNQKNFLLGETVYFSNAFLLQNSVSISNSSNSVSVTSNAGLSSNTKIYIQSNTNNGTMIANIVSVSGTTLTINTYASWTDSNASLGVLTGNGGLNGTVLWTNSTMLILANSTANSTVYLGVNNGIAVGSQSQASAKITALKDMPYDTFIPKFQTLIPSLTSLNFYLQGTANSTGSYVVDSIPTPITYGATTDFLDKERVVASRSNEIAFMSGAKSLTVWANATSNSSFLSPAIFTIKSGGVLIYNIVNADAPNNYILTSEITNSGNCINDYVSLVVTLAPGLEAEDLVVFVGGYLPPSANIYCYCKLLNQYDPDPFNVKSWTPMVTTNITRSSAINVYDYNEYEFTIPISNITANVAGVNSNAAFLNTSFLDGTNNYIVGYTSNSGAYYTTFQSYAIKLSLLANTSYAIPRLTDVRAIATSVGI